MNTLNEKADPNRSFWQKLVNTKTAMSFAIAFVSGILIGRLGFVQTITWEKASALGTCIGGVAAIFAVIYAVIYAEKQTNIFQRQTQILRDQTSLFNKQNEIAGRQTDIFISQSALIQGQNHITEQQTHIDLFEARYEIYKGAYDAIIALSEGEEVDDDWYNEFIGLSVKSQFLFESDVVECLYSILDTLKQIREFDERYRVRYALDADDEEYDGEPRIVTGKIKQGTPPNCIEAQEHLRQMHDAGGTCELFKRYLNFSCWHLRTADIDKTKLSKT